MALLFCGAWAAEPLDALSYGPDFGRAAALDVLKQMKLSRDAYVSAEQSRILDLEPNMPLPRDAHRLRIPMDAAERAALCQLGEDLLAAGGDADRE
ncbi:MAG: hypothetical protein JXR94_22720, partial [Candidatus Hydrogenedentes bacterium]|nr:hypothetical protein [Candidatus Hydrogenedentota bacterium]